MRMAASARLRSVRSCASANKAHAMVSPHSRHVLHIFAGDARSRRLPSAPTASLAPRHACLRSGASHFRLQLHARGTSRGLAGDSSSKDTYSLAILGESSAELYSRLSTYTSTQLHSASDSIAGSASWLQSAVGRTAASVVQGACDMLFVCTTLFAFAYLPHDAMLVVGPALAFGGTGFIRLSATVGISLLRFCAEHHMLFVGSLLAWNLMNARIGGIVGRWLGLQQDSKGRISWTQIYFFLSEICRERLGFQLPVWSAEEDPITPQNQRQKNIERVQQLELKLQDLLTQNERLEMENKKLKQARWW